MPAKSLAADTSSQQVASALYEDLSNSGQALGRAVSFKNIEEAIHCKCTLAEPVIILMLISRKCVGLRIQLKFT